LKSVQSLLLIVFLLPVYSYAQEVETPFSARAYWLELQDKNYNIILGKQKSGIPLSNEDEKYLKFYDGHLRDYYNQLSPGEQERFRNFESQWDEEAQISRDEEPSDVLEVNSRGILPGKKFRLYNGIYGFIYGAAMVPVLGIQDNAWAIGLPVLLAGGSLLLPVINPKKYENMNYSSVLLNRHGKLYGLIDGASLGLLLFGTENESAAKGILMLAVAGSIGMGELGFQLGKKGIWTEGRISGYNHYTMVSLLFSTGLYGSFANDFNSRVYGGIVLASQAAGYLFANKMFKKYNYTRGDILASGGFTFFTTLLGAGLIGQVETSDDQRELLLPTATLLAGSILSHTLTRNKYLTASQGWKVNYTAGAGALLGLGIAFIINSDEPTLYMLLPAAGGLIGWGAMLNSVSKSISSAKGSGRASLTYSIQPENYFYNKQTPFEYLTPDNPGKPVVGLTLTF